MSNWKQAEIYELKHPKVSGTLTPIAKGRWKLELSAGKSNFGSSLSAPSAKAAQLAAEREISNFVEIVDRVARVNR